MSIINKNMENIYIKKREKLIDKIIKSKINKINILYNNNTYNLREGMYYAYPFIEDSSFIESYFDKHSNSYGLDGLDEYLQQKYFMEE